MLTILIKTTMEIDLQSQCVAAYAVYQDAKNTMLSIVNKIIAEEERKMPTGTKVIVTGTYKSGKTEDVECFIGGYHVNWPTGEVMPQFNAKTGDGRMSHREIIQVRYFIDYAIKRI